MSDTQSSATARYPSPVNHSLEALPLDSRIRQLYPDDYFPGGAYANLPHGRTRYWILGPEDGRKVVLIHGLTIPAITWKDIAPALSANGFRVLLYDLYGKGYSEAPKVTYDPTLLVTQLALLLQYVGWQKAAIVGFSMGGGIASAFTASLPHLVDRKVVFISSAGILNSPKDVVRKNPGPRNPIPVMTEIRELQGETLPGYKDAILSLVQHGPLYGLSAAFEAIGKTKTDVLVIHGTDDDIVVHDNTVPGIKSRVPQAKAISIEGAEHDLLVVLPHRERVLAELIAFLR